MSDDGALLQAEAIAALRGADPSDPMVLAAAMSEAQHHDDMRQIRRALEALAR